MDNIKTIAEFFLISISLSFTLFSPIANSKLTGNGFIKLISNLSIGFMVIALVINLTSGLGILSTPVLLKVVSLVALVLTTLFHKDDKSFFMWILFSIIILALTGNLLILGQFKILTSFFLISSMLFLGIITYAMVLGHWYLVVPKLSEKPLIKAAIITWIVFLLKIVLSTSSLLKHLDFFSEETTLGSGYAFSFILLTMRVLFGYVVILGMSFFNWRLVKMRSIQSSTGILYAMTFFIFIGELISSYMFFNYGLLI
jgi:hypothetical protein